MYEVCSWSIRCEGKRRMLAVHCGHVFRTRKRLVPSLQCWFLRRARQPSVLNVPRWHKIQAACECMCALHNGHVLACG